MRSLLAIVVASLVSACASRTLDPLPPGIDLTTVPTTTIHMTAKKFEFQPAEIRVKAGTLVTIEVTSIEGTHGIAFADFGIDERLDEGVTKTIRFYVPVAGEHRFRCSHFCGLGHLGMNGRVIVE